MMFTECSYHIVSFVPLWLQNVGLKDHKQGRINTRGPGLKLFWSGLNFLAILRIQSET